MLTRNLPGEWKEDNGQREGLSEFIDAVGKLRITVGRYIDQTSFWHEKENSDLNIATTGLGWLEQIFVKTLPFSNEQIIGYDEDRNAFKVKTISE